MADSSLETKRYLQKFSSKAHAYAKVKQRAIEYLESHDIYDQSSSANVIIVALLWLAAIREEELTESELLLYLGLDDTLADYRVMALDPQIATMSLEEALDYTIANLD